MMASSLTAERRNRLAQILVSEGSVKVGELAEMFSVSTETIRKDLIFLESEGIARKSHGGAIASSELLERPLSAKALENVDAKNKIAQAAAELIPDKGVIILDSGSTTSQIAKILTIKKGLTIITNSISIAQILSSSDNTVYTLGGKMRGSSMALVGLWTVNELNVVKADIAFLGTDGFYSRGGPCTASFDEAQVKKAMIQNSKKSIVVCDNNKFKMDPLIQYCEWKEIDCVITNESVSEKDISELNKHVGVKIAT